MDDEDELELDDDGIPIHPSVIELWEQFEQEGGLGERQDLLIEMAEVYAGSYDAADPSVPPDFANQIDDFEQCRLSYSQAGLRLGKTLVRILRSNLSTQKQRANAN